MNGHLKTAESKDISIVVGDICDDSFLNKNVSTSKLDITGLASSTMEIDVDISDPKLSISLYKNEVENLKNMRSERTKNKKDTTTDLTFDDEEEDTSVTVVDLTSEENDPQKHAVSIELDEYVETEELSKNSAVEETQTLNTDEKNVLELKTVDTTIGETDNTMRCIEKELNYFEHNIMEVGRRLWRSDATAQHYTKGCLWSPDGTCILVPVHLDGMHLLELPRDLYEVEAADEYRPLSTLPSAVHVKEGGTVYDYAWFPYMNSNDPNSCIWLATRQHEPIHMWDAFTGELRCSYRGYDDVDEVEAAISITFSHDGGKVYGGYKKNIKIFDTNIPGRDYNCIKVKQAVSCLAMTSDSCDTITTGSWKGYINHYDLRAPKLGSLFTLGGHNGGITWLRYAPSNDNWLLFSGARKDNKILQWDMRNYVEPVFEFNREVSTNQRIYFDLHPEGRWLASGSTDGMLRMWDLVGEVDNVEFPMHNDCCNGVNFHPTLPILATSSGQYHFVNATEVENVEKIVDYENAILLTWYGKRRESE